MEARGVRPEEEKASSPKSAPAVGIPAKEEESQQRDEEAHLEAEKDETEGGSEAEHPRKGMAAEHSERQEDLERTESEAEEDEVKPVHLKKLDGGPEEELEEVDWKEMGVDDQE